MLGHYAYCNCNKLQQLQVIQLQRIVATTNYCNCNELCRNFMVGHYAYCNCNGSLSILLLQLQRIVAITSYCNCNGLCRNFMLGHHAYCNCNELQQLKVIATATDFVETLCCVIMHIAIATNCSNYKVFQLQQTLQKLYWVIAYCNCNESLQLQYFYRKSQIYLAQCLKF